MENYLAPSVRRAARKPRRGSLLVCLLAAVVVCAGLMCSVARAATQRGATRRPVRAISSHTVSARASASARRKLRNKVGARLKNVRRESPPAPRRASSQAASEFGEDVEGRQSWFLFKRAYPFDSVPGEARRRAWEARGRKSEGALGPASVDRQVWTPIGPRPTAPPPTPKNWGGTSGRINAVAVSPADKQIILVGSSTGGIWRSSDGGANFAPVSDDHIDLAVGWIAFAPSEPSVVYAGMGDIDYLYLGSGVLKSTNAGQTWARVSNSTLPDGVTARLEVDPSNPDRVYLAQDITINRSTNLKAAGGFFVSTDGGVNWTKTIAGQARDLAIHPANPQTLYVTFATRSAAGVGASPPGLYRSTDAGHTWTNIPVSTTGFHADFWDFRVALAPSDPQRIYIYFGTIFHGERRLQVSRDGGATWQERNSLARVDTTQFGFNTYLLVHPANADEVYLGSRDLWKSNDAGATFTNVTNNFAPSGNGWTYQYWLSSTHPDQHAFAFEPGNPSVVYLANDGGLWKSADGGATLQALNNTLSLVQFNSLALHPTDGGITIGGTQDNGTQRRVKDSSGAPRIEWRDFSGSDGGACFFNPVNPGILYATYFSAWVNRFKINEAGVFIEKEIGTFSTWGESNSNTRIAFYPPFTGNGVDQRLYFGSWRLFVSDNLGDSWTAPAGFTDLTKGGRDVLSAIGVSRSNTNVIYTGSAQGRAMVSTDGGANWTDITAGLPNRFIESIRVDPSDPSVAYLSVSGFGTGHVFKTTNAGASWADASGNLPNVPTNALLIDPLDRNVIYAGTDIGVFRSVQGGGAWEAFNDGLPPVPVTAFASQSSGRIQIATYGRGAYELTTVQVGPSSFAFGAPTAGAPEGAGSVRLTVTRTGDLSVPARVDYATQSGTASERSDYAAALGTLRFAPGETSKTFDVFLTDDAFAESPETVVLTLGNPVGATLGQNDSLTLTITSDDAADGLNPMRTVTSGVPSFSAEFFVRQQYYDFLNRAPDDSGLAFWRDQITACGSDQSCVDFQKQRVSAEFFLSIEFQTTGYLAYRTHAAAYGPNRVGGTVPLTLREFLPDTQAIGRGVVVGRAGWEQQLEANRVAYFNEFVARAQFLARYTSTMSAADFVDALDANTANSLSPGERAALAADLASGARTRAQVLRAVAENAAFNAREKNRAFVLMQYFGYLRRNPPDAPELTLDYAGYNFWLRKLDQFNGNAVNAEMVRSFIVSEEYKTRFGP